MALVGLPRFLGFEAKKCGITLSCIARISRIQSASICSKENREPDYKRPAPFDYYNKRLTWLKNFFWERTEHRMDENSKIIVVEGNIGAGKSTFAKELAEAFDMLHKPEPNMDEWYITSYGYDLRQMDAIVPASYKAVDIKTFYANPQHPNISKFQMRMFALRLSHYIDALIHLLHTGQGVVLERCVFSDFVFMKTMYAEGYINKEVMDYYHLICKNTLDELLRPHLIIYLDISPEVALQRIKKRNDPVEVNSKVLNKGYLESIEHFYKQEYLKDFQKHSEIMIYDWNNLGDVEVVVEDIERVDFDRFTVYDSQLKDWRMQDDWEWGVFRRRYTNDKHKIMRYAEIFKPHITELFHPTEDVMEYRRLLNQIPGEKHARHFNPNAGENVWFKLGPKGYDALNWKRVPLP